MAVGEDSKDFSWRPLRGSESDEEGLDTPHWAENREKWRSVLSRYSKRLPEHWPWILMSFILGITTATLAFVQMALIPRFAPPPLRSYETGFETDLPVTWHLAQTHKLKFTGGVAYDSERGFYRIQEEGLKQYVGQPSPAIDAAWDDLIRYPAVALEEDERAGLITHQLPDNGSYITGLDMFHGLHCVNTIRKFIDREYYEELLDPSPYQRMHIDHCLDYMRQSIQCFGDMTPTRLFMLHDPFLGDSYFLHPDTPAHTCRNFQNLYDWSKFYAFDPNGAGGAVH